MEINQRSPVGRGLRDIRSLSFETGVNRYAEGSVLVRWGYTHVLCTVSLENSVPNWLSGKGKGWLTAEYSMLPRSTHTRTKREREKVGGRTQEIQRLIGRALRSMVDLEKLGERSLMVDCDVLQADGGTRTASISGSCVAVVMALHRLVKDGQLKALPIRDTLAAVSIGMKQGQVLVDLDYAEDSTCDVDMNFIVNGSGEFVEIQGTGEHATFSKLQMDLMTDAALQAAQKIREHQIEAFQRLGISWS